MVGDFSDERQAVARLDHLSRPASFDACLGKQSAQRVLESGVALFRVGLLTGLVIFAAEDSVQSVGVFVHAQIEVRVGGVVVQPGRDRSRGESRAEDVRGVWIAVSYTHLRA